MKALLLEGPEHSVMRGWRHFLIVTKDRRASVIGETHNGPKFATDLGAEFFRAGTWEVGEPCSRASERFAVPRPEILALLHRESQPGMAL